jgi:predicted component of type VI protein secretion system
VILILEAASPHSALAGVSRHTFHEEGGTIGREKGNSWVLPHAKVSGRHAAISYRDGVYYIEDMSRNGVCLNSPANRLERGRRYALNRGDRILIDPYEIRVSITLEHGGAAAGDRDVGAFPSVGRSDARFDVSDPFDIDEPFAPHPIRSSGLDTPPEDIPGQPLDPLELLGLAPPKPAPPRNAPQAADLERGSPEEWHYQPPAVVPAPSPDPAPPAEAIIIPPDYNPLAPEEAPSGGPVSDSTSGPRSASASAPVPAPAVAPVPAVAPAPAPGRAFASPPVPPPSVSAGSQPFAAAPPTGSTSAVDAGRSPLSPAPRPTPAGVSATASPSSIGASSASRSDRPAVEGERVSPFPVGSEVSPRQNPRLAGENRPAARNPDQRSPDQSYVVDFAAVLKGAGLDPGNVTPEMAHAFGQILRVVVSGVMDVMQSRQQIKDEFRMQITRVRPAENNPLKFSANVDDALHNLLVKRNPAYLSAVEAFEDAFADLRHHQIAMLAGMRAAFESMLAEFDPDRLQEAFDRQLNKGLVPAKIRYWDLFRERRHELVKDPEASFRRLFGEEFARAYEAQLRDLQAQERCAGKPSITPK